MDRDALRTLADALPAGMALPVPREWLLELLGPTPEGTGAPLCAVDLTVSEVAGLLGREPVTVRAWCAAGTMPGAYRLRGREWRVPRAALAAFQEREATTAHPERIGRVG